MSPDANPTISMRACQPTARIACMKASPPTGIEHDVDALPVGKRQRLVANALGRVVDAAIGAVGRRERDLVRRRSAGDDARTERLADLDRREPDAAGRTVHKQRLAGPQYTRDV